jgi:hypothetical protein
VRFLVGAIGEVMGFKAFAHESTLHIHQAYEHGINFPIVYLFFQ